MSHRLEKIRYKKMFFIKSFIISLVLMILVCITASLLFDITANLNYKFYGLDLDDYAQIFTTVFGIWKILILQFTLVPAIAFMCLEKYVKKNEMID